LLARSLGLALMTTAILAASAAFTASGQSISPSANPATNAKAEKATSKRTSDSQEAGDDLTPDSMTNNRYENSLRSAPKHFLLDQKAMWTSPARIGVPEATWLVPVAGFTGVLFATDSDFMRGLSHDPNTLARYNHFSNYGLGAMAGLAGSAYFLGLATNNEHQRETGFLSGEAAIDSLIATEALSYMTGRERPLVDNANGQFWKGGTSFPSDHAAAAWAIAGIVAHEYPSPLVKFLSYGAATAVSVSRIKAEQHFPSDVVVGSALGWLVSQYVYKDHHDPMLPGGTWELPEARPDSPGHWESKFMGSPYVPIDSWIYPALLRLAALGYIKSDIEGMRPWTRMECARLVEEASDNIADNQSVGSEANHLFNSLQKEFAGEINLLGGGNNRAVRLESVYTRATGISGEPLRDGYDFGQTIINDDGRPYAEGFNNITGASGWFSDGPFVGYVQGEYQHAPSSPALPNAALQAIEQEEVLPAAPSATPTPATNQLDVLDGYAGMQVDNWEISIGKQEQWWGPDAGGPMLFSTNAEPIEMLQINRTTPFTLPGFLRLLGPIRTQFILGRIGGYHWVYSSVTQFTGSWAQTLSDEPFIEGEKISLKPSPNLEFGFAATRLFAGPGVAFTAHKLLQAIFSTGNGPPGTPSDPGDSRGAFDFTYRIPGLRNWLTFYGDGFTDDEPSPLWGAFDKSAFDSGLYFPCLPKLPKLDFRVEGVYTDNPNPNPVLQHGFFYWNDRFRSGYTNDGNLIGSWIGREGQGAQAWSTYWFSTKDKLQFTFRHQKVSQQFVPFGGTLTDGGVSADFWLDSQMSLSGSIQYETWNFPILATTKQSDVTTSVQFTFWPRFGHVAGNASGGQGDGDSMQ
jgi:membrane-associated phospholipid phosphatase